MGSCFSKKNEGSSSSSSSSSAFPGAVANGSATSSSVAAVDPNKNSSNVAATATQKMETVQKDKKKMVRQEEAKTEKEEDEGVVKKEIFIIKHRKSHDKERDRRSPPQHNVDAATASSYSSTSTEEMVGNSYNSNNVNGGCNGVVRTSSCTKEEVDAILIQCGRLSRSNSSGKAASSGRKYSGSKRSYDFDHHENGRDDVAPSDDFDSKRTGNDYDNDEAAERRQHRHRHRQSGRPSPGRRRTPSREREQQQRSGSRERANGNGGGRRVSRSPGRRSESTNNSATTTAGTTAGISNNVNSTTARPGKMVSVPAVSSVSSLVMDKSNNVGTAANAGVEPTTFKRISVKRNACEATVAGTRSAASPRSKSPARTHANGNVKGSTENQQTQPVLSRSSSRKAEQSPYRRNPLSEIDPNSIAYPPSAGNKASCNTNSNNRVSNNVLNQKPNPEITNNRGVAQGTNCKASCTAKDQQLQVPEAKQQVPINGNNVTVTAMMTNPIEDGLQKPQTLTRTRSARRSRDLDINPEALLNPIPSYATLLLEDIQNFHQKNNPPISLPPCVTKACSILEAVADLNSTTSSNLSCAIPGHDRKIPPVDQYNSNEYNFCSGNNLAGKKVSEGKDPFVESEVLVRDELMEPSFHKYVTVTRGGGGDDMEEQESSGSNSFAGSITHHQNWGFSTSSSYEPNSADSTDRWTSRSNTREQRDSPLGFAGCEGNENKRVLSGNRRDYDLQQNGIGRGRVGGSKCVHAVPFVAAAATT